MCNYLMQLERPRSSSPAKRHQNRRQKQWLVQSFLLSFRCKNSNPGRCILTLGAAIILNDDCPCGVKRSGKMSHKNSSKLFVSLLFLLLPSFYFLALFFSLVAFLSLFPLSKWHCEVEFTRCANFLPRLTLLWQKAQVAQQVLSGSS